MNGILSEVQKQEFLDIIKTFDLIERRILIGKDVDTDITYSNVWSLYHCPTLRFGLSDEHSRILKNIAQEFGCSSQEVEAIESKTLRKMRHPSRSRKLKNILDHTQFFGVITR